MNFLSYWKNVKEISHLFSSADDSSVIHVVHFKERRSCWNKKENLLFLLEIHRCLALKGCVCDNENHTESNGLFVSPLKKKRKTHRKLKVTSWVSCFFFFLFFSRERNNFATQCKGPLARRHTGTLCPPHTRKTLQKKHIFFLAKCQCIEIADNAVIYIMLSYFANNLLHCFLIIKKKDRYS